MSTAIGYDYDYVLRLASRLMPEERYRLLRELPNTVADLPEEQEESWLTDEYVRDHGVPWGEGHVVVTVPGTPLVSENQREEFKRRCEMNLAEKSPEIIEKNRQELLEILLNCPVLTDEELKGFEEARKEINACRLAYL